MKKCTFICLVLAWSFCSLTAWAESGTCLDASDEPHHELLFADADARVFVLDLPRLASTKPFCYAHPYLHVATAESRSSRTADGGATMSHDWHPGEAHFVYEPVKQVVRDEQMIPHREVIVETLHKVAFNPADGVYGSDEFTSDLGSAASTWTTSFTRGALAASKVQLAPGNDFPVSSPNHVLIALTDLELRSDQEGEKAETVEMSKQEARILPAGTVSKLTNTSQQPAKFVIVEF
jgi:hypothetical protein